ncbi:hypothetical protein [Nocardioides sp. WS12]|uniref:hypothetical protein n=1 Tax=Nocardioides sp. WS12 TaxID=2486272 RepID=UPI0015FDC6B2|nr:hypothetical protein [Nocardioides sp. WS12]
MTKKAWLLFVLVVGLGGAVFLSGSNAFKPGVDDVKDPLGRPSALSLEVIHSASEFERITGVLVPKHGTLSQRIQRLNGVADNLDIVVDDAGKLTGKSITVNEGTTKVNDIALPLPGLIASVTGRAVEAAPVVGDLGKSVSGVTTELEAVQTQLNGAFRDLAKLGPRATTIVDLLAQIQAASVKVKPLAPLLAGLSGPLETIYDLPLADGLLDLLLGLTP